MMTQLIGGGGPLAAVWNQWPRHAAATSVAQRVGGWSLAPSRWPGEVELLRWCQAAAPGIAVMMILLGIVYLLFGFSIAKVVTTLNAGVIGGWVGAELGEHAAGPGAALPGAVVACLLAATAAWPKLKVSTAVLGGLLGAVVGVAIWRLSDLDPSFGWSGGLTGLVFCGLLSLLLFRPCVITYTSLQGAAMLVFGVLALILKHEDMGPSLHYQLAAKPFLLPMTIFVPTLIGYVYQQAMTTPVPLGPPAPPKK